MAEPQSDADLAARAIEHLLAEADDPRFGPDDYRAGWIAALHSIEKAAALPDSGERPGLAPHELWQQAGGDRDRYLALMREHGHLVPGRRLPGEDIFGHAAWRTPSIPDLDENTLLYVRESIAGILDVEHSRPFSDALPLVDEIIRLRLAVTPAPDSGERPGLRALDDEIARREAPDYQWFPKPNANQTPAGRAGAAGARGMQHGELTGLKIARHILATPTRDAQPAPAGPEEPREGLYRCINCGRDENGCECEGGGTMVAVAIAARAFIELHDAEDGVDATWPCDGNCGQVRALRAALATTPAPDSGAERETEAKVLPPSEWPRMAPRPDLADTTLRDHETCVPHEHVEADMARWSRDQAASLARAGRPMSLNYGKPLYVDVTMDPEATPPWSEGQWSYDPDSHWLVFTENGGASGIVAYDVPATWAKRMLPALNGDYR
jgi:hypothetical protein